MIKDNCFTMYQFDPVYGPNPTRKHQEDAYPYMDENLMVVADGLGGTGCSPHEVSPWAMKYMNFDSLYALVLPEDKERKYKGLFNEQFKDILADPAIIRTSGYWASRLAIVRYVYAYENVSSEPKTLMEFVLSGLRKVSEELEFSCIAGKKLFPTTLVSMNTIQETENEIAVDVTWAGDSRAYVLDATGLHPLSKDDEEAEGEAMTNLITLSKKDCHFNRKTYTLKKPCVLMNVSDGFFDSFRHAIFETVFLKLIFSAKSLSEFQEVLGRYYKQPSVSLKPDDCTITFKMYGYDSYDALKNDILPHANEMVKIFKKITANQNTIKLLEDPEGALGDIRLLEKDLSQKKHELFQKLSGKSDYTLSYTVPASEKIIRYTASQVYDTLGNANNPKFDFEFESLVDIHSDAFTKIKGFSLDSMLKCYKACQTYLSMEQKYLKDKNIYDGLLSKSRNTIIQLMKAYNLLQSRPLNKEELAEIEQKLMISGADVRAMNKKLLKKDESNKEMFDLLDSLMEKVDGIAYSDFMISLHNQLVEEKSVLNQNRDSYVTSRSRYQKYLMIFENGTIFTPEIMNECIKIKSREFIREHTESLLVEDVQEFYHRLVENRIQHPLSEKSVIDEYLDRGRLENSIAYYQALMHPSDELKDAIETEKAYTKEMEKYIGD